MNKTTRLSITVLLSVLSVTVLFAGSPIRGFVEDITSGELLPAVNIVITDSRLGASTNLDGYFVIDDLNPGVYELTVSCLGYQVQKLEVVITLEVMEPMRIQLTPSLLQLEEVEVVLEQESEFDTRMSPVVSNVPVNVSTIKNIPAMFAETDVLRALQIIPGVKASSELSAGIYVRGGSPDQTLILMDHNVVYNPSHLFGMFSTFNADAVKHLDLLKGGFPAQYGGRSGSVLEVITNDGNRKETEGMVSLGIVSARAALEGPLPNNKGSYAFSGRRTYMDILIAYLKSKDPDIETPDYYFYDANGKVNFDISNKTTLTFAGYGGNDNLDFETGPEENRTDLNLNWGNRTFTSRIRHVMGRNLFVSGNASVSRYVSKFRFGNNGVDLSRFFDGLYDYSLKADVEYLGKSDHKFKTGILFNRYDFNLKIGDDSNEWVDVNEISHCFSAFFEDNWKIPPFFELKPGIRAYYYDRGDYFRFDPRFALVYYYDNNQRFKLSFGRYSQFINVLRIGGGMNNFDVWLPVDETLDPSYSDQVVLGYEWEPVKTLEFTAETYYTDMHNVAELNQIIVEEIESLNGAFLPNGRGYSHGYELMLRRKEGRVTGWIGYSLSWTKRRFEDSYQNDGQWYYPVWDRRHDFIVTTNYAINKKWEISGNWRYNTGQGYTQPVGVYALRYSTFGYDREVLYGGVNNYRFPADHRLDLSLKYKHEFWWGLPATLDISIYNVYNRKAYWRRFINTEENPVAVEDVKLLPMVPLVSYEVRF